MVQQLTTTRNVAAFRALGEVTANDYKTVIVPAVTQLAEQINEINFLFLIDTEIGNFTAGALIGLRNLGKWNRAAIVTDCNYAITFTNGFCYIAPGEFRGYTKDRFEEALNWVQGTDLNENSSAAPDM